jgi:hypothetical protein
MTKLKLYFILFALSGSLSAFVQSNHNNSCVKYVGLFAANGVFYIQDNPNLPGLQPYEIPCSWTRGVHYDCDRSDDICTLTLEEWAIIHYDSINNRYYVEEIDVIIIEYGTFELL